MQYLKRLKGNPGMKAIRIGADYRPDKVTYYDYIVEDNVSISTVKKWFKSTYTWLDIKGAVVIPIEEARYPSMLKKTKEGYLI